MKSSINQLRSIILTITLLMGFSAHAQLVQVQGSTFPSLPATSCTNTMIDVQVMLLCINITYNGASVSVSGSNITIDLDYSMGPICLGAIANVTENVNMGMLPSGTYTITINGNLNGTFASSVSNTLTVNSCCSANPAFTASTDTICPGDSIYFSNTSTGALTNTWYVNNSQVSTSVNHGQSFTNAGTYNIKLVVGATGCTDSTEKLIYVVASSFCCPVNPGFTASSSSGCAGDSIYFTNNSTGAMSQTWYVGSNAVSTNTDFGQVFNSGGNYTISLVASDGSCSDSIFQTIQITDPAVNLGPDTMICKTASVLLVAGFAYDSIMWSDGSTGATLNIGPGTHFVDVYKNGCVASDTIVVGEIAIAPADLGADTSICAGDTITLDVSRAGSTYLWNDNSTNSSLAVSDSGIYWVTITEANGCSTSDTIEIDVDSCNAGTSEYLSKQLQIFPQPAQSELSIRLTSGFDLFDNVRLINSNGQVVREHSLQGWTGDIKMDVEDIPDGVYFIQISGGKHHVNRVVLIGDN